MIYQTEQQLREKIEPVMPPAAETTFPAWLNALDENLVARGGLRWLLAHTFTGVVWGRRDEDGWHLSDGLNESEADETFPRLNPESLLHLRIFGPKGEIYIWHDGSELRGRAIVDDSEALNEDIHLAEEHILWGTSGEVQGDFTILRDGQQKMMHAFPLPLPDAAFGGFHRPARLQLRHYITRHEATGLARITLTRLYDLAYAESSLKKKEASHGA